MSASCFWNLKYKGNEVEFNLLWELLHKIEGKTISTSEGAMPIFKKEGNVIETSNAECKNIWGEDFLNPSADIYLLMAKTSPNLEFEISTDRLYEGGGEGCSAEDKVTYKNRKLVYKKSTQTDSLSISELIERMMNDWDIKEDEEEFSMIVLGDTRIFENRASLEQDIQDFGYCVVNEVEENVRCVVCNNPDALSENEKEILQKAKEFGIQIISEVEYLMIFCEVEASWGGIYEGSDLYNAITFEDFCKYYHCDATVTEEVFNKYKKGNYYLNVTIDNCVSIKDNWKEEIYTIDSEGVIRDENNNVDSEMMEAVERLEKKYNL
jgi:hypothetical protein